SACSDSSPTEPVAPPVQESIVPSGCPSIAQTANMIVTLYPARGGERLIAAATYAAVLLYINTKHQADARTLVFRLLDFTFVQFNAGKLVGGGSLATRQALLAFETGLYCTVGLPTTGLTLPGDPGNGGTVNKVIFPSGNTQSVVTPDGNSGVQLPPNSFNTPAVVVTISVIPGATHPLNTTLDQYGPFYDVKVTPESAITANLNVGICLADGAEIPTVFLAHNVTQTVSGVPTPGIEVLPPGPSISGLCTTQTASMSTRDMMHLAMRGEFGRAGSELGSAIASALLPENAYAGSGGKTGTTKAFSPFGGVDTKVFMTTNPSPFPAQTSPAGSAVANSPSTLVSTKLGAVVPKTNVLFSVTSGGGTVGGASTSTVTTNATGVATVSSWVVNTGANTVQAVGTYANPTVTFALAPVGSGFPQAVAVDPANGVSFAATGGDVVPYGSSYLFLDGQQGHDAGFQTPGFPTAGWSTGSGPFGSGDVGGTVCAINSEPGFTLNASWVVGTDMLLRKSFALPTWWTAPLTVTAAIDNDIAVYVNGNPLTTLNGTPLYSFSGADASNYSFNPTSGFVSHENCATKGSLTFSIPASFLNLGGQNTLAIRARDRGSVNYVDAKISAGAPPTQ
ncbi:MAG TPA: hypothetical protein VGQ76_11495, partial [Thermoanaerobaculia bacterium]|nr:hypothetical protein [Thermoanaerobaculia bacterium]